MMRMNTLGLATLVYTDLVDKGGSSRDVNGREPVSGFMVSTVDDEEIWAHLPSPVRISQYIHAHRLTSDTLYIGAWKAEDGDYYLDVSEHFTDEGAALAAAVERDQVAYYDVTNQTSVILRDTHPSTIDYSLEA